MPIETLKMSAKFEIGRDWTTIHFFSGTSESYTQWVILKNTTKATEGDTIMKTARIINMRWILV